MGLEFCRMPQVYAIDGIVPVVDPTA